MVIKNTGWFLITYISYCAKAYQSICFDSLFTKDLSAVELI